MPYQTPQPIDPQQNIGPTMSSREVAELVEKRHDNVKRTIESLVEKGVIGLPQFEEVLNEGAGPKTIRMYNLCKRDSFVVVAQLSPEFTARLVDRWQELEREKATNAFKLPMNYEEALQAHLDGVRENRALAQAVALKDAQIGAMLPDVQAHARLTQAEGSLNITEAAKALAMQPKSLFEWLAHNGWIYRRPGSTGWLGYQDKCNRALLEHKCTTVTRADGSEKITEQVRITPRGMAVLAKVIPPPRIWWHRLTKAPESGRVGVRWGKYPSVGFGDLSEHWRFWLRPLAWPFSILHPCGAGWIGRNGGLRAADSSVSVRQPIVARYPFWRRVFGFTLALENLP